MSVIGPGEALALTSSACYSGAIVAIAKSAARKTGDNGALLSIIITAGLACAIWLGGMWLGTLRTGSGAGYSDWTGIGWFLLSGILTIVLGRALHFQSVARLGPIRASTVNRLNPFFSVLVAALLLGESISPVAGGGIALIACSFVILSGRALRDGSRGGLPGGAAGHSPGHSQGRSPPLASYGFGACSALCYAFGYAARKLGLNALPDPYFGTFIGAAVGLVAYLAFGLFSDHYRRALRGLIAGTTRWHLVAALCISLGQIAQFAAISYIEVSRVVMISSAEIFFSMILSVYIARTDHRPDAATLCAAGFATAGVVLITLA